MFNWIYVGLISLVFLQLAWYLAGRWRNIKKVEEDIKTLIVDSYPDTTHDRIAIDNQYNETKVETMGNDDWKKPTTKAKRDKLEHYSELVPKQARQKAQGFK